MRKTLRVLLPAVLLSGCAVRAPAIDGCDIAQRYIDAANASRPGLVAPYVHPQAVAVFLADKPGAHSTIEGADAVLEAVANYTRHCESCRSSLVCLHDSGDAVYAREDVRFVDQDGVEQEQSAPLVIEFEQAKIRRIIYLPSSGM